MLYDPTPLTRRQAPTVPDPIALASLPATPKGAAASSGGTQPEAPQAKRRGKVSPSNPAPALLEPGTYEVWRVRALSRTRIRAFERLGEALQYIVSRRLGGRYDVLLPDGGWFSSSGPVRRLRASKKASA